MCDKAVIVHLFSVNEHKKSHPLMFSLHVHGQNPGAGSLILAQSSMPNILQSAQTRIQPGLGRQSWPVMGGYGWYSRLF